MSNYSVENIPRGVLGKLELLTSRFRNLPLGKFSAKSCECMISVHGKACNCEGTEQLRLRTKKEI